jgi:hypothetical protein
VKSSIGTSVRTGLGHGAIDVPISTPHVDSDDLKEFLWLLPAFICWQGHILLSVLKGKLALPMLGYVL